MGEKKEVVQKKKGNESNEKNKKKKKKKTKTAVEVEKKEAVQRKKLTIPRKKRNSPSAKRPLTIPFKTKSEENKDKQEKKENISGNDMSDDTKAPSPVASIPPPPKRKKSPYKG